jgi:hypothetical protein
MKYLSLQWFKAKINKAVDTTVEKVVSSKVEAITDQRLAELQELEDPEFDILYQNSEYDSESKTGSDYDIDKVNAIRAYYLINEVLTVITSEGDTFVVEKPSKELVGAVKKGLSSEEITELFESKEHKEALATIEEIRKENEIVRTNFEVLKTSGEFEIEEDTVYMKTIKRSVPKLLVKRFTEVLETKGKDSIEYQSLKKFWLKCVLNPSARSAEDLYEFLENHNMKIDKHGNFYTYRRVETVSKDNNGLVNFISNAYNKVKAVWKKSPKNFRVVTVPNSNKYEMKPSDFNVEGTDYVCLGDLEFLYLHLPHMEENRYTDNYTRSYDYRVGQIHSMPRNEGSDDNGVSCGKGFHQASKAYNYSGFGDQDILCIVNPMSVLAVPQGEVGKLRVSDWFFAMTLEEGERHILDEDCFDVQELGDIFEEQFNVNLEERIKQGFAEEIQRHSFSLPNISAKEIKAVVAGLDEMRTALTNRVVQV